MVSMGESPRTALEMGGAARGRKRLEPDLGQLLPSSQGGGGTSPARPGQRRVPSWRGSADPAQSAQRPRRPSVRGDAPVGNRRAPRPNPIPPAGHGFGPDLRPGGGATLQAGQCQRSRNSPSGRTADLPIRVQQIFRPADTKGPGWGSQQRQSSCSGSGFCWGSWKVQHSNIRWHSYQMRAHQPPPARRRWSALVR